MKGDGASVRSSTCESLKCLSAFSLFDDGCHGFLRMLSTLELLVLLLKNLLDIESGGEKPFSLQPL